MPRTAISGGLRLLKLKEMEIDMRGAENDEPEMSFRHSYQQGAIELFYAIERFLDPATREVLQAWIEKDVYTWRVKAMLGHPPNWRLNMLATKVCAVAALANAGPAGLA
jgi:hypothetical protein